RRPACQSKGRYSEFVIAAFAIEGIGCRLTLSLSNSLEIAVFRDVGWFRDSKPSTSKLGWIAYGESTIRVFRKMRYCATNAAPRLWC
ncbi:MAG: hypothetical protein Q7U98_08235, partial [Methylicorpusculum sp.]